uniref:Rhodopsin n=2 Tax=Hemiselmis andersenii TaxID=464988 RepID=A0A6U4PPW4_HEMAN|mmetsp:Transcript_27784/g.67756  ORF Transcript_27784/g.67756 Transcript_27784/m.67756 type:complete len:240 (+) Transcript_27784:35-754(+)
MVECTTIEEVGSTGVGAMTLAFLIFIVSTVVFVFKANNGGETRKYYYCTSYICGFAAISYLGMLSGQGWLATTGCRQFFYARYIDYAITTNITILLLGLLSGASTELIAGAVGADFAWIGAAFLGSVSVVSEVKWLWFFINIGALIIVSHHIVVLFKAAAEAKGGEVAQLYGKLVWLTFLCWICYPVVWLFSEGFASFSISFEVCAYALIDVASKVGLSFMVMSANDVIAAGGEGTEFV